MGADHPVGDFHQLHAALRAGLSGHLGRGETGIDIRNAGRHHHRWPSLLIQVGKARVIPSVTMLTLPKLHFVLCLALFASTAAASAQQDAEKEKSQPELRDAYTATVARIQAKSAEDRKELGANYVNALKKLEASLQREGNLDGVLAVKGEREEFEKSTALGDNELPILVAARARYQAALAPIRTRENNELARAGDAYIRQLNAMQVSLTKAGNLDAAIAVKKEIEDVQAGKPAVDAPAAPAPTPERSGVFTLTSSSPVLDKILKSPAKFEAEEMKRHRLEETTTSHLWGKVPAKLLELKLDIYMPENLRYPKTPTLNLRIKRSGYLVIACDFNPQGSNDGWMEASWDQEKFESNGWEVLRESQLGGEMVFNWDSKKQVVLVKEVKEGEILNLRCNKYFPPFPIVIGG